MVGDLEVREQRGQRGTADPRRWGSGGSQKKTEHAQREERGRFAPNTLLERLVKKRDILSLQRIYQYLPFGTVPRNCTWGSPLEPWPQGGGAGSETVITCPHKSQNCRLSNERQGNLGHVGRRAVQAAMPFQPEIDEPSNILPLP